MGPSARRLRLAAGAAQPSDRRGGGAVLLVAMVALLVGRAPAPRPPRPPQRPPQVGGAGSDALEATLPGQPRPKSTQRMSAVPAGRRGGDRLDRPAKISTRWARACFI